mgnify:CR=1 FL=1
MYEWKRIGERVHKEREAAGMTMDALATEIGTTRQTISRWEHGDNVEITLNMLVRLCNIFNCEMGYLLCEYNCKTKIATDIHRETGLDENVIQYLETEQKASINNPNFPTPFAVSIINCLIGEYLSATEEQQTNTVLFAIKKLFSIPREYLKDEQVYTKIELLNRKMTSFSDKSNAIHIIEAFYGHEIAERMIKLSKGDGEHG